MGSSVDATEDDYPFNLKIDKFYFQVTGNQKAQRWFNRGFKWCYGFNHEEAIWCFEQAIAADPNCAMAYWGIAYALGPNYNKIWERYGAVDRKVSLKDAFENAQKAAKLSGSVTPKEQALIKAIQSRYPAPNDEPPDTAPVARKWNSAYADAMKPIYDEYRNDPDIVTLYVEAQMLITPWQMWLVKTGGRNPDARTIRTEVAMEEAFKVKDWQDHPGLCHLYVHFMEMSRNPERAADAADKLREIIPDAGHLVHMPTHIDLLTGDYKRAIDCNAKAIAADDRFAREFKKRGTEALWYMTYRLHNCKVLIQAAMMSGQRETALKYVTEIDKIVTPEILHQDDKFPMADLLEAYRNIRVHVLIRFGNWEELLNLQFPDDRELFCVTTAHIYYGRAIAYAATDRVEEAEREKQEFLKAKEKVPATRTDHKNPSSKILGVAEAMLAGELLYRRGKLRLKSGISEEDQTKIGKGKSEIEDAFAQLRIAVSKDDDLIYAEPWGWMVPVRHSLAALLMEQNQLAEARELYFEDLGNVPNYDRQPSRARWHPKNVWAWKGLQKCQTLLLGRAAAQLFDNEVSAASAVADVDINTSCFCSKGV